MGTSVAPKQTETRHDQLSHIVANPEGNVTEAYVNGVELTALCGKTWTPTRDPHKFPMCHTCKRTYAEALGEDWPNA